MQHFSTQTPSRTNALRDQWLYFRKLLCDGAAIASAVPSSRWTARSMIRGIEFRPGTIVVELGAGTGPITAELLQAARGQCRCLVVERDADFCRLLRERFPDVEVVEADALDYHRILDERRIDRVDHVLCELPIPWFPPPLRKRLLRTVRDRLAPGGSFRQLTHLPGLHRALYEPYFSDIEAQLVLRNLPPAGCYTCRR